MELGNLLLYVHENDILFDFAVKYFITHVLLFLNK